jgi:glycosyltransferase involved in cell wall biosynthesis
MELAKLAEIRRGSTPWLLTLHEAWISDKAGLLTRQDSYELALVNKFDAVITCSDEDAQLLDHPSVYVVPNGADVHAVPYSPSPESGPVLFVGPFRYLPNLKGIRCFLETIYPYLLKSIPNLRLWVLGGVGAVAVSSRMACFKQEGVTVMDYVEQPRPLLDQCAITINPLHGVRGSCLKVAESIAAGRVCISTKDGARGFLNSGLPALVVVDKVEEFAEPVTLLLSDPDYRHFLERPSPHALDVCSWDNGALKLLDIYSRMVRSPGRHSDQTG